MKTLISLYFFAAFSIFCVNAFAGSSLFTSDGTQYQIKNLSREALKNSDIS